MFESNTGNTAGGDITANTSTVELVRSKLRLSNSGASGGAVHFDGSTVKVSESRFENSNTTG